MFFFSFSWISIIFQSSWNKFNRFHFFSPLTMICAGYLQYSLMWAFIKILIVLSKDAKNGRSTMMTQWWERFSSSDFMHQLFALHKAFIQIHSNLRLFYWSKSIYSSCLGNSIRMSCENEFNHLYYHLSDDGYVLNSCLRRNQCNFLVISLLLYIILCVHYLNGVYFFFFFKSMFHTPLTMHLFKKRCKLCHRMPAGSECVINDKIVTAFWGIGFCIAIW